MDAKIKRGQILKSLRKSYTKRKLNQADVAEIIGVSVQAYQKYEYGTAEPTFDTIDKLADFYGVTADYLIGRQSKIPDSPLDEFAQRERLKMLEKLFFKKYFSLTDDQRDKILVFLRELAADVVSAEEARNQMEAVRVAAYRNPAGGVPREAEYPQEVLDDMDKNAPLTDPDL